MTSGTRGWKISTAQKTFINLNTSHIHTEDNKEAADQRRPVFALFQDNLSAHNRPLVKRYKKRSDVQLKNAPGFFSLMSSLWLIEAGNLFEFLSGTNARCYSIFKISFPVKYSNGKLSGRLSLLSLRFRAKQLTWPVEWKKKVKTHPSSATKWMKSLSPERFFWKWTHVCLFQCLIAFLISVFAWWPKENVAERWVEVLKIRHHSALFIIYLFKRQNIASYVVASAKAFSLFCRVRRPHLAWRAFNKLRSWWWQGGNNT